MVQANQALIRKFLQFLKEAMKKGLPGTESQYKMAPRLRLKIKPPKNVQKAAVLLLLYPHQSTLYTVLTKRPEYFGAHSGQIGFPGGKQEHRDKDIVDTALRESREELGIITEDIQVIGNLTELYIPISNMLVFPVVAFTERRPDFQPDSSEVEYIIETALRDLLKPETLQKKTDTMWSGKTFIPCYMINGNPIWGATAMILSEFLDIIRGLDCLVP